MGNINSEGISEETGLHVNSLAHRQINASKTFKEWYLMLCEQVTRKPEDERLQGQLTMITSVLFLLLPNKEYKKLTTDEHLGDSAPTLNL